MPPGDVTDSRSSTGCIFSSRSCFAVPSIVCTTSVVEISREVKDLAARARDRKLKPEEFTGSTFTISNLGMFGVTEFTAIINPPESAILAVGAVQNVPVVGEDGSLRAGHRMKVTLSSDHRVVDGAMAAQFLGEVRRLLENPVSLFV